ncbi:MAG TPA: hypothetical protein VGD13_14740 [Xanthobacteraceae bacterium]|jgi:hypothetical protein
MLAPCRSFAVAFFLLCLFPIRLPAAEIQCAVIGSAYDDLFNDVTRRVESVVEEIKAASSGNDQRKSAVRAKFCAIGGELLGLYKFVRALANDCSKQGADVQELLDVINKQMELAQGGIKSCG